MASYQFHQEGNYHGTTSKIESLTIEFESVALHGDDNDGFFVLKTEGWSIDSIEELEELFNRIKKTFKND